MPVPASRSVAYDYKMRNDTIRSLPAYSLLILAILNYVFIYYFLAGMNRYNRAVEKVAGAT